MPFVKGFYKNSRKTPQGNYASSEFSRYLFSISIICLPSIFFNVKNLFF